MRLAPAAAQETKSEIRHPSLSASSAITNEENDDDELKERNHELTATLTQPGNFSLSINFHVEASKDMGRLYIRQWEIVFTLT